MKWPCAVAETVLIAGYFGKRNAGDEAILGGMLAELRGVRDDLRFQVVSWDPESTRRLHGVEAIPWTDVPGLIDAVREASLVIVGGGGLFHDYWGVEPGSMLTSRQAGIAQYGGPIVLARLLGVPSMLYAVGVGPLRTPEGRQLTRELFDAADAATVRDAPSRELLAELGCSVEAIEVVPDPAFHLPRGAADPAIAGVLQGMQRPILGVALRHWAMGAVPADWQSQVAAALDGHLAEKGGTALFVPLQDGESEVEDDVRLSRAVMTRMERGGQAALTPDGLDPLQRFHLLEGCDAVLGMRLHAVIAALRGAVPVVGLAYDPKVVVLMEASGLGGACLGPEAWQRERIAAALGSSAGRRRAEGMTEGERRPVSRSAEIAAGLLGRGPIDVPPGEAALRRLAVEKVREVLRLEGEVEAQRARVTLQAEETDALRRTSEMQLAQSRRQERSALKIAAREKVARRQAESELRRIRSSKGGRVLWSAWSVVWVLRERFRHFSGATRRARRLIGRLIGALRALARRLRPLWLRRLAFASGPNAYVAEDNSTVVLYTDRGDLFPGYLPRASLSGSVVSKIAVSLVVTVKNEEATASGWLQDIAQQTRAPDEVIILDGGSSDRTLEMLSAFAERSDLCIRLLERPGETIAARRNAGVLMAKHDYIAMTDFGCDLDCHWLERLVVPFEADSGIEVVAGGYRVKRMQGASGLAAAELVPTLGDVDPQNFLPATRSVAFRKRAWRETGGFPEWLSHAGEDTYLALELKRLSGRWGFVPEAQVQWHAPDNVIAFWRKLSGWAVGDGESGVRAAVYGRCLVKLAYLYLAAGVVAVAVASALAGWSAMAQIVLAGAALVTLVGGVPSLRRWMRGGRSLFWAALGLHARSVGYLRGLRNRPTVAAKKHAGIPGIRFVLGGVPIDDAGGGQRGAQIAKEWLRRGHLVVFIHRFPKNESVDLRIATRHPRLHHWSTEQFDWDAFRWEYGDLLKEKPVLAIVEFPLPEFVSLARSLRQAGATVVYDRIDAWDTPLGAEWYSRRVENQIIEASDLLVATAPSLVRDLEAASGRKVLYIPNAVDSSLFDPTIPHELPSDLPASRPVFLYVGSLWGDWFDWDLLLRVADDFPDASVVVIGDYRGQCPRTAPNLHFLGLKPQSDLPAYLAHADIGIVPWKKDQITAATSPLKAYEYLAMGLPVVAPDLEALPEHPLVHRASGPKEFLAALSKTDGLRAGRNRFHAFRRKHGWPARVDTLESFAGMPSDIAPGRG